MPYQDKVSPSRAARGYRNSREDQRSRRHGDLRRLEVRDERLSRSAMDDERFGANSLTATSRGGLLLSGRLRTSRTQDPISIIKWYTEKCTRVLLYAVP